ncbi:MAG: GNAT family N-acetyltransferase [Flavobacteriales bacterium]|nr:GNAT family N-acetyltransferase [Flavobacteriales bacterium]
MQIVIRRAERRDVPQMLALVKELATFEKEPDAVTVTEAEMLDAGFGAEPVWFGWVAELEGVIIGMAVCYTRYSTWRGRCLYLEDIVVTEAARGRRVGEKLFKACAAFALDQGHHHMLWQVLDWNTEAMRFYTRLGATFDPKWVNGRMTREEMERLVESGG